MPLEQRRRSVLQHDAGAVVFIQCGDDGNRQASRVAVVLECLLGIIRPLAVRLRENLRVDVEGCDRAPITAATRELQQAVAHGIIGCRLQVGVERREHAEAGRVGVLPVTLQHFLAHHLGNVGCREFIGRPVEFRHQRIIHGLFVLRLVDIVEVQHAAEHVIATHFCIQRAAYRVIARRCGQDAGKRCRLGNIDIG